MYQNVALHGEGLNVTGKGDALTLNRDVERIGRDVLHTKKRADVRLQDQELDVCDDHQVNKGHLYLRDADRVSLLTNTLKRGTRFTVDGPLESVLLAICGVICERHHVSLTVARINTHPVKLPPHFGGKIR